MNFVLNTEFGFEEIRAFYGSLSLFLNTFSFMVIAVFLKLTRNMNGLVYTVIILDIMCVIITYLFVPESPQFLY